MINGLIVSLICAGVFAAAYFLLGKGNSAKTKEIFEANLKLVNESHATIKDQISKCKNFVSAKQISNVQSQLEALEASIAQERAQLAKVETSLSKSQQDVEARENVHQNQKIAKEDEEERLNALLERHETLAAESISLEHSLAEAMKNLDKLISEMDMTDNQRAVMKDLQTALQDAGARLRELILEYETVKNRVAALKQQHQDLEEEYTRLVELQLG